MCLHVAYRVGVTAGKLSADRTTLPYLFANYLREIHSLSARHASKATNLNPTYLDLLLYIFVPILLCYCRIAGNLIGRMNKV